MLDGLAAGSVTGERQLVILHRDGVEIDFLGGIIDRTQLIGALEHDVLKVMGDTRVGAIDSAGVNDHGAKDLGLTMIHIDPHIHAVEQHKLLHLQRRRRGSEKHHGQEQIYCNSQ